MANRRQGRVRNLAILGGSLGLHGIVLILLLSGLNPPALPRPDPPVEMQILSLPRLKPTPKVVASPTPLSAMPAPPAPAPRKPAQTPPGVTAPSAGPTMILPSNPGGGADGPGAALGKGLRAQLGCTNRDYLKLTKAEIERCTTLAAERGKDARMLLVISPEKKAAFDGDCKKDDQWCLYRTGQGPYPGLFALGKKKK